MKEEKSVNLGALEQVHLQRDVLIILDFGEKRLKELIVAESVENSI